MMVKLNNCIDCGEKLNDDNRSRHQPGIRCLSCFRVFSDRTTATLENMIDEMKSVKRQGNDE